MGGSERNSSQRLGGLFSLFLSFWRGSRYLINLIFPISWVLPTPWSISVWAPSLFWSLGPLIGSLGDWETGNTCETCVERYCGVVAIYCAASKLGAAVF